MGYEEHDLTVDGVKVGTATTYVEDKIGPPPGGGFLLRIMFDNAREVEIEVTKYDPVYDGRKIVDAVIEQNSTEPGQPIVQFVDWSHVIYVEGSTIEPRVVGRRK